MVSDKFNEKHRQIVIREIAQKFNIGLTPILGKKVLKGTDDNAYCIVGGSDWHGIPGELINSPHLYGRDVFLIVALLEKRRIRIFMDSMDELIENKDNLSINSKNSYQFKLNTTGNETICIRQIEGYCLKKVGVAELENK